MQPTKLMCAANLTVGDSVLLLLLDLYYSSYLFWFVVMTFGLFYFFFFLILNEFIFVFHLFNQRMVRYSNYLSQYGFGSVLSKMHLSFFFLIS